MIWDAAPIQSNTIDLYLGNQNYLIVIFLKVSYPIMTAGAIPGEGIHLPRISWNGIRQNHRGV